MIDIVKFLLSASWSSSCVKSLAISASPFAGDGSTLLVAMLTDTTGELDTEPNFIVEPFLPLPLVAGALMMVAFGSGSLPIWFVCAMLRPQRRW